MAARGQRLALLTLSWFHSRRREFQNPLAMPSTKILRFQPWKFQSLSTSGTVPSVGPSSTALARRPPSTDVGRWCSQLRIARTSSEPGTAANAGISPLHATESHASRDISSTLVLWGPLISSGPVKGLIRGHGCCPRAAYEPVNPSLGLSCGKSWDGTPTTEDMTATRFGHGTNRATTKM